MEDFKLVLAGLIMLAAFIGVISCAKKQHYYPRAKNVAIVLFLVVVTCCFYILKLTLGGGNQGIARGLAFKNAATYVVANKVKEAHAGKKILIILPPSYGDAESISTSYETSMLEVFKETMGEETEVITARLDIPIVVFEGGSAEEYDQYLAEQSGQEYAGEPMAKHFNEIFEKYSDIKVVVSFVDLPYSPEQLSELSIWSMDDEERPSLYLLSGDAQMLRRVIAAEYISGLVIYKRRKERKKSDKYPDGDFQVDFDKRYHYVDKDNISDHSKEDDY